MDGFCSRPFLGQVFMKISKLLCTVNEETSYKRHRIFGFFTLCSMEAAHPIRQDSWFPTGTLHKKRTFTVICSLTLGLVLLTCIYAKNASFDIDKYMSQQVISDFEVKDSSIATNFGIYNPYGTTISDELVSRINSLDGLEATGHLYSQVFVHEIGATALANIQTYYNADERLPYIEATDAGLAQSYHDMIDSGECVAVLYGVDGLILDAFSEDYRILDGTFDKDKFQSGGYILVEAAVDAEEMEKETQPTYSVGDMVNLNGQQYKVMGIVANITTVTEGVNSEVENFLSFYLPADTFREMYPDNTIRKMFFDVTDEFQPQAEQMLIDYRNDTDKSLTFTSKNTLAEHYQEQTRANTIFNQCDYRVCRYPELHQFNGNGDCVQAERICHDTKYRHDKAAASQYVD